VSGEQGAVDATAGTRDRLQALAAGLQEPVQGVDSGDDRPGLDPADHRLGNAGLLPQLALGEAGPEPGLSKNPGRIHVLMIAEMLSE
jgi:hypothetical protein